MSNSFPASPDRPDPYRGYAFLVFLGDNPNPVAAVSGVGPVRRYSDVVEYREGGSAVTLKLRGRTYYEPVVLTRGITQDAEFEDWANAANHRTTMAIVLLNEERLPVRRYVFHQCWVSEYQALPFLDARTSATAFEHITVQNEGWERDTTLAVPPEQ